MEREAGNQRREREEFGLDWVYFRYKKKLTLLEEKGIAPLTRRPYKTGEKTITQKHKDLVLKLRQDNPTRG